MPTVIAGVVAIGRAEDTAVAEVRDGNKRTASAVAGHIDEYVLGEQRLVRAIGSAVAEARSADGKEALLDLFLVEQPHVRRVAVFDAAGALSAGDNALATGLEEALAGKGTRHTVKLEHAGRAVGHVVVWAEPIVVAGSRRGAVVAEVDLVGLWRPINAIRIGETGRVSLISREDRKLLAHGNASKRSQVFGASTMTDELIDAAERGALVTDRSGAAIIVTSAAAPSIDGLVIIEQSTSEALGAVTEMKQWLIVFFAAILVIALLMGVFLGRQVVRPLEKLRKHIAVLGKGDLTERIDVADTTRLVEARELATAINDMAEHLDELQREKIGQERLATFARVAAGLAHDIRHPIESVRTACYGVLDKPDDAAALGLLRDIGDVELPRLKKFVDDLHGLARTGSLETERLERDALELAEMVVNEIKVAPKWGGAVEFSAAGESTRVPVDADLIKRALYNLLSNGAEACLQQGKGGGRVTVEVSTANAGETVVYDVRDTGAGIEKERLADLLSSDFRSTKRSNGVGLGLGVVRQVAESHGGRLAIDSELGVGSTFSIYLPAAREQRDPTMEPKCVEGAPKTETTRGGSDDRQIETTEHHHRGIQPNDQQRGNLGADQVLPGDHR